MFIRDLQSLYSIGWLRSAFRSCFEFVVFVHDRHAAIFLVFAFMVYVMFFIIKMLHPLKRLIIRMKVSRSCPESFSSSTFRDQENLFSWSRRKTRRVVEVQFNSSTVRVCSTFPQPLEHRENIAGPFGCLRIVWDTQTSPCLSSSSFSTVCRQGGTGAMRGSRGPGRRWQAPSIVFAALFLLYSKKIWTCALHQFTMTSRSWRCLQWVLHWEVFCAPIAPIFLQCKFIVL